MRSEKAAVDLIALHHESGGEIFRSSNAGASWSQVAKDNAYVAVGIFDASTLVLAKNNGGISRSTDNGKSWNQVAPFAVTGHVVEVLGDTGYLLTKEGLVASKDKGATWTKCGAPIDATFGPLFADAKHMVAWGGGAWLFHYRELSV